MLVGVRIVTTTHLRLRLSALLLLGFALAAGCSNGKAKDKDAEQADATVPVETQQLRRAAMLAVHSGTAAIEAHEEAEVVAKNG